MDIKKRIVDCIASTLNMEHEKIMAIPDDMSLQSIGLNSLNYVRILAIIELEFNFRFDEDELLLENFNTFEKLIKSVQDKMQ